MSIEDLKALGVKSSTDLDKGKGEYFPISAEFLLTFDKSQFFISAACEERFCKVVNQIITDLKLPHPSREAYLYYFLEEEIIEDFWTECEKGNKIDGYPFFT